MSSPKSQGLMGFAGSENAKSFLTFDPGGNIVVSYSVSHRYLQIRNFQSFAMIFSPTVEVFDADHRSLSPATKSQENTILLSLLFLPWDRGKYGICSLFSLVLDLSQFHKTLSLQWAPWDRGKKI
jgi:hypothetical protein